MTNLRDRDGTIWTPEGDDTYSALDGTLSGWRRKDIDAQHGPVIETAESANVVNADVVRDFCAERAQYVTALNQSTDGGADYHRWQGHAEARRQLSERLGLPTAWPASDQKERCLMGRNEPKPNVVKRAAKKVAEHVNVKKASRTLDKIVDEEAPRAKDAKPGDAKFMRGLGQRIGFVGIVVATVLAAIAGLAGCNEETGRPAPATAVATCEEDQSWCWDCHTDGNRRCGNDEGAVQR